MMRVFDASAVLTALFMEPGVERVTELWADGENLIGAVNYAEVVTVLNERGMSDDDVLTVMEGVPLTVVALDQSIAHAAGLLRAKTKSLGLSLGDRACLALGASRGVQIVTAERLWRQVPGFDLVLIR